MKQTVTDQNFSISHDNESALDSDPINWFKIKDYVTKEYIDLIREYTKHSDDVVRTIYKAKRDQAIQDGATSLMALNKFALLDHRSGFLKTLYRMMKRRKICQYLKSECSHDCTGCKEPSSFNKFLALKSTD